MRHDKDHIASAWRRRPETRRERYRRLAGDALAVSIGLALTALMLAPLLRALTV